MTEWSDILTAAMQIIDDERWREELAVNPAQFYRAKSQYIMLALPMLSKPPELLGKLTSELKAPEYADSEYVSAESTQTGDTLTISTGITGYALASASMRSEDGMTQIPAPVMAYDKETGELTLRALAGGAQTYSLDFYTDGEMGDLTPTQMRLFALATAVVWDNRFQRDWLSNTMKLKDASFETVNESNYMEKANARYLKNKETFEDALRSYEQQCAYTTAIGGNKTIRLI